MSRRVLLVPALAAIVAAGVFVGVVTRPKEPKILLGLGDSVASGWGLGPALGYPNNPLTYAKIAADRLGYRSYNVAIGSACMAKPGDPGGDLATRPCPIPGRGGHGGMPISVLDEELARARRVLPYDPSAAVVMAGANDIDFINCIFTVLSPVPLPVDVCSGPVLSERLDLLERNTRAVLGALKERYPRARRVVVGYFNPVPPKPPDGAKACPVYELIAAVRTPLAATTDARLEAAARSLQGDVFDRFSSAISSINGTLRDAATGTGSAFVVPDFSGHDICAADAWVYGPEADVSFAARTGLLPPRSLRWKFSLGGPCPEPSNEPPAIGNGKPQSLTVGLTSIVLKVFVRTNCVPHPTVAGQAAIADVVVPALRS